MKHPVFSHESKGQRETLLVIGGIDPSGGAGLAADVLSATAFGVHCAPVASVITVQNSHSVSLSQAVESSLVLAQAQAVLSDLRVNAIKLGALGNAANAVAIATLLDRYPEVPVVTDPVLAASGGGMEAGPELIAAYRERLIPKSFLITPNEEEYVRLDGSATLHQWFARGLGACLITGGDSPRGGRISHRLLQPGKEASFDGGPKVAGSFHGTGCSFATALAASLAKRFEVSEAVEMAQAYVHACLCDAFQAGTGQKFLGRNASD